MVVVVVVVLPVFLSSVDICQGRQDSALGPQEELYGQ